LQQLYAYTLARLPALSAYEQARLSWAKPIESYAAVQGVFKPFFEPFRAGEKAFPYTVLAPSYQGFLHRTPEKLIADLGSEIDILERGQEAFETLCFPVDGISYVEYRTILLDSRFQISGITRQGVPAASTLRFNSVTDYLFDPILETIRLADVGPRQPVDSSELGKFDRWVRLNYKFMNFARRSLLGGEKVLHAILQPEIRAGELSVFGRTYYRSIAPTLACILTDRELIVIRETERKRGEAKYGGIWDYIPLRKIATLSLDERGGDLLALSVGLPAGAYLKFLFQASARHEIDHLLKVFGELTT